MLKCTIEWVCKHKTYEGYCMAPFTCSAAFEDSEHGPDSPEGVSGASDCSDPRSGADNREALAAKRPIPPRVAGRNSIYSPNFKVVFVRLGADCLAVG